MEITDYDSLTASFTDENTLAQTPLDSDHSMRRKTHAYTTKTRRFRYIGIS
jgi:hypothetical protein